MGQKKKKKKAMVLVIIPTIYCDRKMDFNRRRIKTLLLLLNRWETNE